MPGILERLRRWAAPGGARSGDAAGQPRRVRRRLARAIESAMAAGDPAEAGRLARRAARFAAASAPLSESLARLELARGDAETALRTIDACRSRPASLRLLRCARLLLLGERTEAQLDLRRWVEAAAVPLDARVLLAILEWRSGHHDDAMRFLQRNLRHLDDPRTLAALLLISAQRDRPEQVAHWASRLRQASHADGTCGAGAPDVEIVLQSLGLPRDGCDSAPGRPESDALCMELLAAEPAIPALVEAQRLRHDPATTALLRRALERVHADLADPAAGAEALARLALIEGDRDAAARWASRGLALNPMSAPLARLTEELAVTPGARQEAA